MNAPKAPPRATVGNGAGVAPQAVWNGAGIAAQAVKRTGRDVAEEQRRAGFGGINRYKSLEGFKNSEMVSATTKRLDIIKKQMTIQSKSLDEITKLAEEKERLLMARSNLAADVSNVI